ncbi:unnamed protein product [Caenorhabditis sp. 36 PRJEB53466]|nr:unnamed protein product [Caenorhabditis sp. 36 PRJEB53466]
MSTAPKSPHIWTGNADAEDRVESLIKKTGCWEIHLKVSDCMGEHRDWRKCQDVVKEFRTCVQSVQVGEPPKEEPEPKKEAAPKTEPEQKKFWFRNISKDNQTATAINEIELLRVADAFENGHVEEARGILTEIREKTKNNRTHEITLIDSILHCFIAKEGELSPSELSDSLHLLSVYESILVDFGDQLQFFRTKALLLSKLSSDHKFKSEFKNTMALLCELCSSFENWQLFEEGERFLNDSERFGIKLKMEKILRYEIEHSKGFVKENLERKMEEVKREAEELAGAIEEEKREAIRVSLNSQKDFHLVDSAHSSEFRAHESRSKNTLIPVSDQPTVISEFSRRYPFLFSA